MFEYAKTAQLAFAGLLFVLAGCTVDQTAQPPVAAVGAEQAIPGFPAPVTAAQIPAAPPASLAPGRPVSPPVDEYYPGGGGRRPAAATAASIGTGDITLDFKSASIGEIAAVILGDLLQVPYTIDAGVSGVASISTGQPISREGLIPVFEAVLASLNATLINQGGVYRVAAAGGLSGAPVGVDLPPGAGFEVYPLAYIGAAEMAKIIKPLLGDNRPLTADTQRNLLIAGGTGAERQTVRETIAVFDVDAMRGQSVLLTSLANVEVETILFELENIFGDTGKGPLAGLVRFVPIERLNAVMVLSAQPRYLQEARDWIARLDRTRRSDERRIFVYFMQHGPASETVKTLQDVFGVAQEKAATEPTAAAPIGEDGAVLNVTAPGATGQNDATPPPRVTADKSKNALLIHGTERQYQQILEVLTKLDIEPLQVMLEAQIIEVSLGDTLRYGVQYFLDTGGIGKGRDSLAQLTAGISPTAIAPNLGAGSPPTGGFAFTLQGRTGQSRVVLDALSDLTTVNMISAPTVFVLDNQVARLRVGDEVPIITQTAEGLTTDARTVNTVQYRSTGVLLEVTPRVNTGGMVTLEIVQEVSAAVNTAASGTSTIDSPTIQQRSFLSTVGVRDGETVLLGGLIREQSSKGRSGIPGLHAIPVVGNLFGRNSSNAQRTELMVMLTPHVVRNRQESNNVTAEMKEKFQGVLQMQREGVKRPRNEFER